MLQQYSQNLLVWLHRLTAAVAAGHTAESELQGLRAQVESKRFKCTQCGKCCTGPGKEHHCNIRYLVLPGVVPLCSCQQSAGEVWVTELECLQLAQHLGLTISQFLPRYTKSYSNKAGWRMLRSRGKDAVRCG